MEAVRIEGSLHLYGNIEYMNAHIIQDTCEDMDLTFWNGSKVTDKVTKMDYSDFLAKYKGKKVEVEESIVLFEKDV